MTNGLERWLDDARRSCDMRVEQIPWGRSREWVLDELRLRHRDGAFFDVVGAAVTVGGERRPRLDQPLIDQREIGILGFLVRPADQGTEILVQAKPEPGNVGLVQAAPSVQATESNYRRRHHGKATPLLGHFTAPGEGTVLADSLQSEQGTRFLGKYNRNMVVAAAHGAALDETVVGAAVRDEEGAHRWVPVSELQALLLRDFQVNTDARSVLASGPWETLARAGTPFAHWRGRGGLGEALLRSFEADGCGGGDRGGCDPADDEDAERLRRLRDTADFVTHVVGLSELSGWRVDDASIASERRGAFPVRQYRVTTSQREVTAWDQPLIAAPAAEGQVVLLCQERDGVLRFLFDARPEIGLRERLQYGPTVQDFGEDRSGGGTLGLPPRALGAALAASDTLLTCLHSDEGGRFFRCVSRYTIALLPNDVPVGLGESLSWMTLGRIARRIRTPGFFTNEARSLVSMMLALA